MCSRFVFFLFRRHEDVVDIVDIDWLTIVHADIILAFVSHGGNRLSLLVVRRLEFEVYGDEVFVVFAIVYTEGTVLEISQEPIFSISSIGSEDFGFNIRLVCSCFLNSQLGREFIGVTEFSKCVNVLLEWGHWVLVRE